MCATIAEDKRGKDIAILDIQPIFDIASYFVIVTCANRKQIQTLADVIVEHVREAGGIILGVEGYQGANWVLLDLGDVVVHLFLEETRAFYDLDLLWGDAELVDMARNASPATDAQPADPPPQD